MRCRRGAGVMEQPFPGAGRGFAISIIWGAEGPKLH